MKVLRDEELDIAARRAVQFREAEEDKSLNYLDEVQEVVPDMDTRYLIPKLLGIGLVMFGGVICLAYAAVQIGKLVVTWMGL